MKTYNSKLMKVSLVREVTDFPKVKVSSSREAEKVLRPLYDVDMELWESFYLIMLNNANNTIGYAKISQGGINATVVDVRLVAKYAIDCLATGVILSHNHPSGNLIPSEQDKSLTEKIKAGLKLLDITVLDHIILTADSYYSFADEGLL